MATVIDRSAEDLEVQAPALSLSLSTHRLFAFIAIFAMVIGTGAVFGGIAGATYTYQQAVAENITTPDDAVFAEVPVRGPLSMWAQVRHHHRAPAQPHRGPALVRDAPHDPRPGRRRQPGDR
jgi:hypothetical protein